MEFRCKKCSGIFTPNFDEDSDLIENGYTEPICDDCGEEGEFADELDEINHYSFADQDLGF